MLSRHSTRVLDQRAYFRFLWLVGRRKTRSLAIFYNICFFVISNRFIAAFFDIWLMINIFALSLVHYWEWLIPRQGTHL